MTTPERGQPTLSINTGQKAVAYEPACQLGSMNKSLEDLLSKRQHSQR